MISVDDDSEYTITIADLIKTLSKLDEFILLIWTSSDLPFKFTDKDDFLFLQESVKIVTDCKVEYIFYDIITGLKVIYYDECERMAVGYG